MTVGWGIISTGSHVDKKIVPAMKLAGSTRIAAVYSRSGEHARSFAEKHGITAAYDNIDGLLQDPHVEAVFIASPNFLHGPHTLAATRAGRHVLVEKPMAVSVEEGTEMVRSAREHGVRLGVGFHLRHHPGHRKTSGLIQQGILGTISMIQGQWCFGQRKTVYPLPKTGSSAWWNDPVMMGMASTLMGTGVHVIDLLYFLTGRPIVEVAAITDGQTAERPLEQAAAVAVRLADGTIGTICAGRRMPDSENDVMIYGSHGRIALRDTLWESFGGRLEIASESITLNESYERDSLSLYRYEIEAFNRAIEKDEPFRASGEDGLHAVGVLSAIVESARTGRAVRIAPAVYEF
ncbi:MAG: Gfo/Idh/MocA family oxidoreductase [Thermodesulfobacteriota bacterium]